ncbi:hypothetical protein R1flu_012515 [Riccia fluitans]|uniref:Uncharacterized protein n=1 Tax=Riccia fluitans TaxID=41844 RepID=A0ABD1ZBZ6_9MARC
MDADHMRSKQGGGRKTTSWQTDYVKPESTERNRIRKPKLNGPGLAQGPWHARKQNHEGLTGIDDMAKMETIIHMNGLDSEEQKPER